MEPDLYLNPRGLKTLFSRFSSHHLTVVFYLGGFVDLSRKKTEFSILQIDKSSLD
jgi:hypothetical protein